MKKSILYIAALALGATSCTDFLTEEPKLSQSNELTMSDYDGLVKATEGAYTRLPSSAWYGGSFILNGELSSGNATNPVTFSGSGRYLTASKWEYNENLTWGTWGWGYYTIAAANNVINNIEGKTDPDMTQQDFDNLKAECLFLRALCHLNLVGVYGQQDLNGMGVPVVLVTENGTPARNTVKEVYDQVIKDLLEAEQLMEDDYSHINPGNDPAAWATKPAIQALLSRAYLYMGDYQHSAEYATKVINSGKFALAEGDDYLSMFTAAAAPQGGEIIFEVYSDKTNDYWDDSGWTMCSHVTSPGPNDGSADVCATDELVALYKAGDVRLNLYKQENSTDWFCLKYAGKVGAKAPKENNTIVLRLSEMYLNRAEAIFHGAFIEGVTAQMDLDAIAAKRGVTADAPNNVTILNERRRELAFEGHYFFDAKRTKTAVTTWAKDHNDVRTIAGDDKRWALPIPKAELEANPNIVQNEY